MVSIVQDKRRSGASLSHASSLPFSSSLPISLQENWEVGQAVAPTPVASKTPLPHCPVLRQCQMTRLALHPPSLMPSCKCTPCKCAPKALGQRAGGLCKE